MVSCVLDLWLAEAEKERKKPIDLSTYLTIGETDRGREAEEYQGDVDELPQIGVSEGESGPIEASFLHLVELAASIRRDGLTNPITVVRKGPKYTIETGERRWLAYHLLNAYFESFGDSSEEDWSKIPARIMDEANVWRQASENNARDNLNAVSKTRQLALLLMDLLGREHFQPFEAFEVEQDFYAQVADGNEWRIPRGSGEMLLNAIGLKNPRQLRYYRALLRMPNELWIQADDLDLTEGAIRDLIQDTGKIVPVSAPREKPEYTRGKPLASKEDRERLRMLRSLGDEVSNVDDTTRQMLLQEIEAHKDWLKRIEKLLKG